MRRRECCTPFGELLGLGGEQVSGVRLFRLLMPLAGGRGVEAVLRRDACGACVLEVAIRRQGLGSQSRGGTGRREACPLEAELKKPLERWPSAGWEPLGVFMPRWPG